MRVATHTRGAITPKSKNPADKLLIHLRMLDDARDLSALKKSLHLTERIVEAPSLAPSMVGSAAPFLGNETEEQVDALIRRYAGPGLHAAGTCRMRSDNGSVVETPLNLRGISGLKVIDALIMPRLVSANTNAPAITIGEKGPDLVKKSLRS